MSLMKQMYNPGNKMPGRSKEHITEKKERSLGNRCDRLALAHSPLAGVLAVRSSATSPTSPGSSLWDTKLPGQNILQRCEDEFCRAARA